MPFAIHMHGSAIERRPLVVCIAECRRPILQAGAVKAIKGYICTPCFQSRLRASAMKTEVLT